MIIETKYFTLYSLNEGVYAAIAKTGQGAWSNAGVVDLGEELLVFDTFSTPSAAEELRKQAEKITGKKVRYVINSHYHGDHVFGNQVFTDTTIISTALTHKWCKDQNEIGDFEKEEKDMQQYLLNLKKQMEKSVDPILKESILNQFNEMSKVLEELPSMKIVLPSLNFEKKLSFYGSKRNVELYCLGGGHSPSDTFLYVPDEKIAFMGDLLTRELHLPIYNPEEFIKILEYVKRMDIDTVLPGHGYIGELNLCDTLINYLSFLTSSAKEAHRKKVSLDIFISEFKLPSEYSDWKGVNGVKSNLIKVYNHFA